MARIKLTTTADMPDDEVESYLISLTRAGYPQSIFKALDNGIAVWAEPEDKVKTIIEIELSKPSRSKQ